jgi:hypothetical protein
MLHEVSFEQWFRRTRLMYSFSLVLLSMVSIVKTYIMFYSGVLMLQYFAVVHSKDQTLCWSPGVKKHLLLLMTFKSFLCISLLMNSKLTYQILGYIT